MYHRYYTTNFKKSLKKVIHFGKFRREVVESVVDILASGEKLPLRYIGRYPFFKQIVSS
jgi:mRNA-degrading endonuclease YafQ of YafQ-DinJ toxin-antitoxin module